MKKFYLVALLFLPLFSIAQSNYKSGFAVTLKGDTLRGYINLKEWGHNPKEITFKSAMNDKARQMGLSEINYFEVIGYARYRQYRVAVSSNAIDIAAPTSAADTASEVDNVFLKVLQTGKHVTLYAYHDALKERFYIKDNEADVPAELSYGLYQDGVASDKVITRSTYRVQLEQLVLKYSPGNDKLMTEVQGAEYKEDPLEAIAAKINGKSEAQASIGRAETTAVRFFAGAGIISNTVKAGQYYGSPSSKSSVPKITGGADLIINPSVGHLVFRLELAYSSNNYNFKNTEDPLDNSVAPWIKTISVKQNIISITPQAIFNIYNGEGLKVFVDLGYDLNMVSYSNHTFDSKSEYSAVQFKAGVVIAKRLEIYGAYFPSSSLTYSFVYSNDISSYQVGLNYYFGKGAR